MTVTNKKNIPLPFAVMLATDNYDMVPAVNKISVTTLLKSVRRVILSQRGSSSASAFDVSDVIAAAVGTAMHGGLEQAWQQPHGVLRELGFPASVVDRLEMNPINPQPGGVYGYTEIRTEKPFEGFIVSGSCDFILDGTVWDYKTVGIYKYQRAEWEDYRKQISMYQWLNQDKITDPVGRIGLYIRDWDALKASYDKSYPQTPFAEVHLPLMSLYETEKFMRGKINLLKQHVNTPEPDLPQCTPEELWQGEPVWQYVSAGGAKKNFPTQSQAEAMRMQKGSGSVVYKPAKVKACEYCSERPKCSQAAQLEQFGLLDPN